MIEKVSTALDFLAREKEVIKFWNENDIFKKSMKNREGQPVWTFFDGPPTANGKPHIGHIETRAIKDLLPRFHTMKGKSVTRKAGWDTHGLPVELEVEKLLGLDGKEQIEEYGIEPFIKKCKESVWKYKGEWERMSERVGYWADMENPYITYDNDYIESEWWSLKTIAEKGLLYKGHKVVPYCPRCGTALSSHEVSQGYKEVKERSAVVRFKVKGEENTYIYAWTTTPWTLPSNVALCVNPDETYAKFDYDGRTVIMGDALIEKVLGEGVEVANKTTFPGSELKGLRYEPLFDFQYEAIQGVDNAQNAWTVVCDDYVTMTDGTGVVHQAPAFGEDDARVGRENQIPFLQLVDAKGEMTKVTRWPGVFVKKADPMILEDLEKEGKLVSAALLHPRLSLLLALRHPADLLRPQHLVHPHDRGAGQPAEEQQHRQLVSGQHPRGPLRQLPGERHRLGPVPRALLGHPAAGVGVQVRQDPRGGLPPGAARAGQYQRPARARGHRAAPPLHRRRDPDLPGLRRRDAAHPRGHRLLVRLRRTRRSSRPTSRPTSSPRPSTRPAAGSTR